MAKLTGVGDYDAGETSINVPTPRFNSENTRMTYLTPKQEYFILGEKVQCDNDIYGTDDVSLSFAKLYVSHSERKNIIAFSAGQLLRTLTVLKWYNVSYSVPVDVFNPQSNLMIAFCIASGTMTKPKFINVQSKSAPIRALDMHT
ncbi:unnamed protein product [Protopolystoma xenopodis]|uniref:Uncharacterized protein n=1 Tax=Protopolystoma xenopodis TaxID=117903 RepID=A0A3S5BRH8_9PLAT|nr:unnamed protein product [Protopolystoma xenopodis]